MYFESIVSTTTSIYRHMNIHVHGHAVGLRHKEERRRKERHSKTQICSMHTLRQGDTCTTKTKKDHMYIVHVHKARECVREREGERGEQEREGGSTSEREGWGQERV